MLLQYYTDLYTPTVDNQDFYFDNGNVTSCNHVEGYDDLPGRLIKNQCFRFYLSETMQQTVSLRVELTSFHQHVIFKETEFVVTNLMRKNGSKINLTLKKKYITRLI